MSDAWVRHVSVPEHNKRTLRLGGNEIRYERRMFMFSPSVGAGLPWSADSNRELMCSLRQHFSILPTAADLAWLRSPRP